MSAAVTIRAARAGDLAALFDLEQACFSAQDAFSRRSLRYLIASDNSVLLAQAENRVVGQVIVLFRQRSDVARIYSIAVHPEMRGKKIGGALLAAAEAAAIGRKCTRVRLEVRQSNLAAQRIYALAGYGHSSVKRDYYPDGETGVVMEKSLAS